MGQQSQANMISRIGAELMLQGVKASGAVKGRLLVMSLEQSHDPNKKSSKYLL